MYTYLYVCVCVFRVNEHRPRSYTKIMIRAVEKIIIGRTEKKIRERVRYDRKRAPAQFDMAQWTVNYDINDCFT